MATVFRSHVNLALTSLVADHRPGDGQLVVESADEMGSPTVYEPLAITVTRQSSAFSTRMDLTNSTIFECIGIVGNTLEIQVAEGTTDRDYFVGDFCCCSPTAKDMHDIQNAINNLELGTGGDFVTQAELDIQLESMNVFGGTF